VIGGGPLGWETDRGRGVMGLGDGTGTYLDASTAFEGVIRSSEPMRIDGRVKGEIHCEGTGRDRRTGPHRGHDPRRRGRDRRRSAAARCTRRASSRWPPRRGWWASSPRPGS
jgi:hypothetical protein